MGDILKADRLLVHGTSSVWGAVKGVIESAEGKRPEREIGGGGALAATCVSYVPSRERNKTLNFTREHDFIINAFIMVLACFFYVFFFFENH